TRRFEPVPVSAKQASVQEHPHGLDGIERDPLGASTELAPTCLRTAWRHPVQQRLHRCVIERFEEERGDASPARSPAGPAIDDLGTCQTEEEDGLVTAPIQQMLDEVEELRIGPLEIFEDEHDRAALCDPFDEPSPRGEQVVA